MTRTELAERLDVSMTTVSRICSAKRRPGFELMVRIRAVLCWTLESQADALRESTARYAVEFKQRMENEHDVDTRA